MIVQPIVAAGVEIESYWPMVFTKMAEKRNFTDFILNITGGGAPVATAGGGGAAVAAPAKEEKKDEPTRENDVDLRLA
ncbi:hypothetical protein YC2023_073039 [Brassica napus]